MKLFKKIRNKQPKEVTVKDLYHVKSELKNITSSYLFDEYEKTGNILLYWESYHAHLLERYYDALLLKEDYDKYIHRFDNFGWAKWSNFSIDLFTDQYLVFTGDDYKLCNQEDNPKDPADCARHLLEEILNILEKIYDILQDVKNEKIVDICKDLDSSIEWYKNKIKTIKQYGR